MRSKRRKVAVILAQSSGLFGVSNEQKAQIANCVQKGAKISLRKVVVAFKKAQTILVNNS